MPFQKAVFRPGINRENTNYSNEGGWWDADKVRFRSGTPEKIGGWERYSSNTFEGVARSLFNWNTLDGQDLMGVGTNTKYYIERGGQLIDETPVRASFTQNNPFTTGPFGSTTITLTTSTDHGAIPGDTFFILGATGFASIPTAEFNTSHTVLTTPSTTTLTFQVTTPTSLNNVTGGGTGVEIYFEITPGLAIAISGYGWGAGPWSRGTWGSAASSAIVNNQIRLWSADNYGEDLVINPRQLPIYYWDATNGLGEANRPVDLAELLDASDTPVICNTALVSDERHLIAFGTNVIGETDLDPLLIRWSSQEEPANWTPDPLNTAGELRVGIGSEIITARQTRQEILVWTDVSLHSMKYLGAPFVYGIDTLSDNISIMSPNAAITVNNVTYWIGKDKFYTYSGYVQTLPCSVRKYVFDRLDLNQALQTTVGLNEKFTEITWFYCSNGSYEVDSYVTFNYQENIWYYGTLGRSAWIQSSTRGYPFACGYDGYLYQHETGNDSGETNPPTAFSAYIESSDFDIQEGEQFSFIQRLIPDVSFAGSTVENPSVTMTVKVRNFPGSSFSQSDDRSVTKTTSVPIDQYTNQVWVRLRGRQAAFRIESDGLGVAWQLGATRMEVKTDGRR